MNKAEMITAVSIKGEMTKVAATQAIETVFAVIEEALSQGEKVQLVGFGTFSVKERAERTGRNPQTQEPITIPACKVPAFKAGKGLKDVVKGI